MDQETLHEESQDIATPLKSTPEYRRRNMEKARKARLESLKLKRESKAKKPKKVLEYNIDSSDSESASEEEEFSSEDDSDDKLPLEKPKLIRQKRISTKVSTKVKDPDADYKEQMMKYMVQQEKKMKQLKKKVSLKSKPKRKTVVQVIQPQNGGSSPPVKRSTSDIYFDYILGKK